MHVLIVSQYYPPETGGPPNRIHSLARGFAREGHRVTVVTAKPNHPEGVIWKAYRGGLFRREVADDVTVLYAWVFTREKKTFFSRIAFYLSFMVMGVLGAFRVRGPVDVVIASSPPLFVGVSGWLAARIKRARYVFDVRDLWPDVAVALGELRGERLTAVAKKLELFIYRKADAVSAVTQSFCNDISSRLRSDKPVVKITNGTVVSDFERPQPPNAYRERLDLPEDRFIVAFVGNLGLAQGLDHIVEAAARLEKRVAAILFLFVGDGSVRASLEQKVGAQGLCNVVFRDRVPLATAADYMAASDVLLVPLANDPIYSKFIPSKLFDSMAVARPVLLSVDGEARSILEEADAGIYYPAEDASRLAWALEYMVAGVDDHDAMGRRGRSFVRQHFARECEADRMVRLAESLVSNGGPGAAAQPVEPATESVA